MDVRIPFIPIYRVVLYRSYFFLVNTGYHMILMLDDTILGHGDAIPGYDVTIHGIERGIESLSSQLICYSRLSKIVL